AGAKAYQTLPTVGRLQYLIKQKGAALLKKKKINRYAQLIAKENVANLFNIRRKPETVKYTDGHRSNLVKLLKLARAMLQKPVDFTKQPLYPLSRLGSIPAYT